MHINTGKAKNSFSPNNCYTNIRLLTIPLWYNRQGTATRLESPGTSLLKRQQLKERKKERKKY